MILAGDVGGTNTRLCLVADGKTPREMSARKSYSSGAFPSLPAIIERFLAETGGKPHAAAFGVAGPVKDGKASATNLDWKIDADEISACIGGGCVEVRNDLETTGLGLAWLAPEQVATLNGGAAWPEGNGCLIAAGTGLGESILVREKDGSFRPIPSEGGHADFGPRDAEQDGLLAFLRAKWSTVSWERVVSGPGLVHVYEYLCESCPKKGADDRGVLDRAKSEPLARAISESALDGSSRLARAALTLFVKLYGAEASNLALKALATGGVWIGGGIAPRILPALTDGTFLSAFTANVTLGKLLAQMPVSVVLEPDASLIGAAALALGCPRGGA